MNALRLGQRPTIAELGPTESVATMIKMMRSALRMGPTNTEVKSAPRHPPKDGVYVDACDHQAGDRYGGDECPEAGDIAEVGWVAKCPHADAWHEEVALLHSDQSRLARVR